MFEMICYCYMEFLIGEIIDMFSFRDCFPPLKNNDWRFEMCRFAMFEEFGAFENEVDVNFDNFLTFFECLQLLNSEPIRDQTTGGVLETPRLSVAKDFFHTAAEICFLGRY